MPKEYRACAFCGTRKHKSDLLRVTLPDMVFDFWQNMQSRGFYICQQNVCINKIFKRKALYKYINNDLDIDLLNLILKESIRKNIVYSISGLFDKYGLCSVDKNTEHLVLCRYDVEYVGSNKILLDKAIYNGDKKICIIYSKYKADKLIKYKNLITNIDGLFYGELNGIKKSE